MANVRLGKPLSSLVNSLTTADQVVIPQLTKWMAAHDDMTLDEDIARIIMDQLTHKPRVRSGSFSSSSAGKCLRAQVYNYLGQPGTAAEVGLKRIFGDGTWRHLRLQALMLQAGIIDGIELPLRWKAQRSRGTVDGHGHVPDNHPRSDWQGKWFGLEIKGANTWVAQSMKLDGPERYYPQVARYFLSGGFDLFVVYIEDKNTQDEQEYVITPEDVADEIENQKEELYLLNEAVDQEQLPPRLPLCERHKGEDWRKCSFGGEGGTCHLVRSWPT